MNNVIKGVAIFSLGVGTGYLVAYKVLKTKYEKIAQEEINSVKETFKMKNNQKTEEKIVKTEKVTKDISTERKEEPKDEELEESDDDEDDSEDYDEDDFDYNKYETLANKYRHRVDPNGEYTSPYVIPPSEFGTLDDEGYEIISLMYYADGVLADDNDEVITDVEDTVTYEAFNHFGEYEEDCVYVRNDRLKVDYEILLSQRDYYGDIIESKPYLIREE